MSHSGLKILYHLLNGLDGVHAERAFLPEPENIAIFNQHNVPLFSLERSHWQVSIMIAFPAE